MGFEKVRYNAGKKIIRLKVEEDNGILLDKWTVMEDNFMDVVKIIAKKYGLVKSKARDLDWAM